VLAKTSLEILTHGLSSALQSMGLINGQFGAPQLVASAAHEAERLFQGYAKSIPSKEGAHAAALAFMRGHVLDGRQRDLIASVLAEPLPEVSGNRALGNGQLAHLFNEYEKEAHGGELWRLTWYGLLSSYFIFDAEHASLSERKGWELLRALLERTWPYLDSQSGTASVPDWVKVLRQEAALLSRQPTQKYARDYLAGHTEVVQKLSDDLGISPSSWFWHDLMLSGVQSASEMQDREFRALIPRLVQLMEMHSVFRNDAIERILIRYHACKGAPQDDVLRDYVVRKDVWKNPKLKAAGIATAWNRVPDEVYRMVLGWVNERNLKDFFDILAARNKADEGRLAFWSKYMKQITWTRLVFGEDTMSLKGRNREIRDLIAREEGTYAMLTKNKDVDAFIMGIGDNIIVEFSKAPNAAYVYPRAGIKFDLNQDTYRGDRDDLKYGLDTNEEKRNRFAHVPGWQNGATLRLNELRIFTDEFVFGKDSLKNTVSIPAQRSLTVAQPSASIHSVTPIAPRAVAPAATAQAPRSAAKVDSVIGSNSSILELESLLARFPKAEIKDSRSKTGGRLWVEDPSENRFLANELRLLGFKWANSRMAWYLPER
jgi:hypothetical protein